MPPAVPTNIGDVLVLMEGGHKTVLSESRVTEVEATLARALGSEMPFVYFQPVNYPDNGVAINPRKVVAVVAKRDRDY